MSLKIDWKKGLVIGALIGALIGIIISLTSFLDNNWIIMDFGFMFGLNSTLIPNIIFYSIIGGLIGWLIQKKKYISLTIIIICLLVIVVLPAVLPFILP